MEVILAHILQPLFHGFHLAGHDPLHGDVGHIEDQNPKDQQGCRERDDRVVVRPVTDDGQGGKNKTQEDASRIAQEDDGGLLGRKL